MQQTLSRKGKLHSSNGCFVAPPTVEQVLELRSKDAIERTWQIQWPRPLLYSKHLPSWFGRFSEIPTTYRKCFTLRDPITWKEILRNVSSQFKIHPQPDFISLLRDCHCTRLHPFADPKTPPKKKSLASGQRRAKGATKILCSYLQCKPCWMSGGYFEHLSWQSKRVITRESHSMMSENTQLRVNKKKHIKN